MHTSLHAVLYLSLAICLLCVPAVGQYTAGDTVVTDQTSIGSNWPLWGITPSGKLYTVTASLPLYAWSITPAPDNRSLWVSGKGNAGYTTATVAPDGTITNINVDFQNLFASMDVDGNGNLILGNLVQPEIKKRSFGGSTFTTLHVGAPLSNIQGGGLDLQSGDLLLVDSAGLFQARLYPGVTVSTVVTSIPRPQNGAGLHADPDSGTLIGSWGNAVYRVSPGSPGLLTTVWTAPPGQSLGALDRDPADGWYVMPSAASSISAQTSAVYRFDTRTSTLITLATFPSTLRAQPLAATVAGSRHLCGGGGAEAQPGMPFTLLVSSPNEPGVPYVVACSFGYGPGIPVGKGRKIYLTVDAFFLYSLKNLGIFTNFQGILGSKGEAIATLRIPRIAQLSGFRFYAAAITINQGRFSVISDTLGVTIQ